MSWTFLLAVGLVWIAVAVVVGALVGHGIAFGTGSGSEPPEAPEPVEAPGGLAEIPRPFAEEERLSA